MLKARNPPFVWVFNSFWESPLCARVQSGKGHFGLPPDAPKDPPTPTLFLGYEERPSIPLPDVEFQIV